MPGESGAACLDADGQQALSLLRQLGLPAVIGVASGTHPDQAGNAAAKMKGKAAARKRAAAVLAAEVSYSTQALTQQAFPLHLWVDRELVALHSESNGTAEHYAAGSWIIRLRGAWQASAGVMSIVMCMQLSGDNKVVTVDDESDCQQLIRALQDINAPPPQWRRQRPQLLLDAAHFHPLDADKGTLTLR